MTNSLLQKVSSGLFFSGGQWRTAVNEKRFPVLDPANGATIALAADCSNKETEDAIGFAKDCFGMWSQKEASFRSTILTRWYEQIIAHKKELAEIITYESGKPLRESEGEVLYGAGFVKWFAEEALRVYGDTIPSPMPNQRTVVIRQPIGVAAAITPWNFPVAMITRKVAPALAAGCTIITKPAEETPLSALALAVLSQEAGFPPGAFNVLTSHNPEEVGSILTGSKTIRKLSFTGSTEVGKSLMAACAGSLKRLSFELGGNAPFIVLDDADVDKAVDGAIASKFRNSGQTCVCTNRIFVHSSLMKEFTAKFTTASNKLSVGPGIENHDIGPMINSVAFEKVRRLINGAVQDGAQILTNDKHSHPKGNYIRPTVLTDLCLNSQIVKEEIFGPVATLFPFDSDDQVIELANATNAGLAAYFYGKDQNRIWNIAEQLEFGMVGINTGLLSNISAPFGGVKESGFGREGSKYGIEEYLNLKYLCFNLN